MPQVHTDWTAAQALALPDDDWRYEVLDGELVVMPPPSWAHQIAVEELFRRLGGRDGAAGHSSRAPVRRGGRRAGVRRVSP